MDHSKNEKVTLVLQTGLKKKEEEGGGGRGEGEGEDGE